jgi:hypothetical protein
MTIAIRVITGVNPHQLSDDILTSTEPLILRGLADSWPLVQSARVSQFEASKYLLRFYRGQPVGAFLAAPHNNGRYFYNEEVSGFDYGSTHARLDKVFEELWDKREAEQPPSLYVGSTMVDQYLPGLRAENDLALGARDPLVSIWIGNRSRIAAHHDLPDNIAVVAAGKRRFTLFPPEQLPNLYIGPLDLTPAGQAISMVDFHQPDFARFPRFAEALEHAHVAELEAGDAIFIPSMWWHHVEALAPFNVLVNYWWRHTPAWMDSPTGALMYAIMTIRNLPPEQRRAWEAQFDHYVFHAREEDMAHIPPNARGSLSMPLPEEEGRKLRAQVLSRLKR